MRHRPASVVATGTRPYVPPPRATQRAACQAIRDVQARLASRRALHHAVTVAAVHGEDVAVAVPHGCDDQALTFDLTCLLAEGSGIPQWARWELWLDVLRTYAVERGHCFPVDGETYLGLRIRQFVQNTTRRVLSGDIPRERAADLLVIPGWVARLTGQVPPGRKPVRRSKRLPPALGAVATRPDADDSHRPGAVTTGDRSRAA